MLDVIKHKQAFFNASYANYEKCLNRQFMLIPDEKGLAALKQDFTTMINIGMFYGEKPLFDNVIHKLRELETKLNTQQNNQYV